MGLAFAAPGKLLPLFNYSAAPPEPVWTIQSNNRSAETPAIPNGSYSGYMAIDDAQTFRLTVKFASAPGVPTDIEIATDPTFADAQVLDTIPAGAATAAFWASVEGVQYSGFIRLKNSSGVEILSAYGQKQVTSTSGV